MWHMSRSAEKSSITGENVDLGGNAGNQTTTDSTPLGFWARLTTPPQSDTDLYSFIEVQDDGSGDDWTTPNAVCVGTYNTKPLSGNQNIPVPGPPTNLSGTPAGTSFYYVVTATWLNNYTGESLQSAQSNEISTSGGATLNWTAPAPCTGFTLTGYSIWRGIYQPGSENTLAGTTDATTTTFTDGGGGTPGSYYIPGGNAGPVVWMSPHAAYDDFYKFIDPPNVVPLSYVQITGLTPQTITLFSGGTIDYAYEAILLTWDDVTATFATGITIWAVEVNGYPLNYLGNYKCWLLDVDDEKIQIWATEALNTEIAIINSGPNANGLYDATIQYYNPTTQVWSSGANVWLRDANQ